MLFQNEPYYNFSKGLQDSFPKGRYCTVVCQRDPRTENASGDYINLLHLQQHIYLKTLADVNEQNTEKITAIWYKRTICQTNPF